MHYSYSKKCFTCFIVLMLLMAKIGFAAVRDTTAVTSSAAGPVSGIIVDENNRVVIGATITVKNKTTKTTSDKLGHFNFWKGN